MSKKRQRKSVGRTASLTIPELEQSKRAVLNILASVHSKRSYKYAIERFIAWYCDRPSALVRNDQGLLTKSDPRRDDRKH
jgi:hypothetical protein